MPADPPSSSGTPDPDRPSKPDSPDEVADPDLWNLDEELPAKPSAPPVPRTAGRMGSVEEVAQELSGTSEKSVQRGKTKVRATERPKEDLFTGAPQTPRPAHDEIGDLEEQPEEPEEVEARLVVIPEEDEAAPAPQPKEVVVAAPAAPSVIGPELKSSDGEARKNRPKSTAAPKEVARSWAGASRRDIMSLGAFAFVLLLIAIWVLSRFFTQLHFESNRMEMPDYPVKGQHAVISTADTYWREPVREGAARDVARREVVMIPVLELTLDGENSPSGALRVIFRNSEGVPIGDSITRSFQSGRFDATGNSQITFPSTDGFTEQGTFNGYRTRSGDPWTADVLEGPSVDAAAGSFKKLVQIPVLPQRR